MSRGRTDRQMLRPAGPVRSSSDRYESSRTEPHDLRPGGPTTSNGLQRTVVTTHPEVVGAAWGEGGERVRWRVSAHGGWVRTEHGSLNAGQRFAESLAYATLGSSSGRPRVVAVGFTLASPQRPGGDGERLDSATHGSLRSRPCITRCVTALGIARRGERVRWRLAFAPRPRPVELVLVGVRVVRASITRIGVGTPRTMPGPAGSGAVSYPCFRPVSSLARTSRRTREAKCASCFFRNARTRRAS